MKARVDRKALAEALAIVSPAIPLRPQVPILAAVELHATDGKLSIRATDYEITIWRTLDAEVGDEGVAFVSGHRLRDLASKFSGDDITLSLDKAALVVASGRATYRLALMAAAEFPEAPQLPEKRGTANADDVSDALRRMTHASKGDELDSVRGMALEAVGNTLVLATTDRHRIAVAEVAYAGSEFVTRPLYGHMISAFKGLEGQVDIHANRNSLAFANNDGAVMFQLLDGEYPAWRRLIDKPDGITFTVEVDELDSALERACLIREKNGAVVIDVESDGLRISVRDDRSDGSEVVGANADAAGQFGVNPVYLRELLACISEPRVEITSPQTGIGGRIKVTGLNGDQPSEDIHIVMSQRLNPQENK